MTDGTDRRKGLASLPGESAESLAHRRADREATRWYVLTLPLAVGTRDSVSPARGLEAELERRRRRGERLFEYFAPSYVEVRRVDGRLVNTRRPLLFNYIFIHASENEIFRLKRDFPLYNLLPRVFEGDDYHYPYLSESEMANLRWVAASYADELPVYVPEPGRLRVGDRVRVTSGVLSGVEAEVVVRPGGGRKDLMVRVLDCLWVPLLTVRSGEYEVISLSRERGRVYESVDNDRIWTGLHEALGHYHSGELTEADRSLAREALDRYARLEPESDVMRCKVYALLLRAYRIAGDEDAFSRLLATTRGLLPSVKAEQARASLLVTLYGCTGSFVYQRDAHAIVDAWCREPSPKRVKRRLIDWLADYDRWFGHSA